MILIIFRKGDVSLGSPSWFLGLGAFKSLSLSLSLSRSMVGGVQHSYKVVLVVVDLYIDLGL